MQPLEPPTLADIKAAQTRLRGVMIRTPLVRLNDDGPLAKPRAVQIYLKLENLQPIGSFKVRGAGNAMLIAGATRLAQGVYTASAGNMAQGVAWHARRLGIPCSAVVPDHAPQTKLDALDRLGASIVKVPFAQWAEVLRSHRFDGLPGLFIHPVSDPAVVAGNATIGLEILEDLPDVDAIVVPFGGGGLSCGIASAVRAMKPAVRMFASEVATAAPLSASLAAGAMREVVYTPSFVDGIGAPFVLQEMWPMARRLLDGSIVMSLEEVAAAIRLVAERNRVIAEGAAGTAVAAALAGKAGGGKIVCIVSGGNIDIAKFATILDGRVP
jgi:threonine dehydratase